MSKLITDSRQIARYWWIFPITGSLLIFFSAIILDHPVAAFGTLTPYFIAAFFLNGLIEIFFVVSNQRSLQSWVWHLIGGLFDLAIGLLLLLDPVIAAASLPLVAGLWLLFRSIAIVGRFFDLPAGAWPDQAWILLLGLAGLGFSFLVLYNQSIGAFTLITWTTLALLSIGIFYIILGFYLRSANKRY